MGDKATAINAAVEESSLGERACCRLLSHDLFIRNNLQSNDVVVVSVGGNDIALKPSLCTIVNMLSLVYCTSNSCLEQCTCGTALPCDDYCCGCTTSFLSNFMAWPCGFGYFIHLFKTRITAYVNNLISNSKGVRPKKVLICMIYYIDETPDGSWADRFLSCVGYDSNPKKLQLMISKIYEYATKEIRLSGVEVIPVPFFVPLNGKDTNDYDSRVEPSDVGGAKLAKLIVDAMEEGRPGMSQLVQEFNMRR